MTEPEPPGSCSCAASLTVSQISTTAASHYLTHLPLVQFVRLGFELLDEVLQNLAQSVGIRLERRHDMLDGPLDEDPVGQAKALAVGVQFLQRLKDLSAWE